VPPWLWEALRDVMPNGELHSPYGATECLPVSTVSATEILAGSAHETLHGAGVCVGRILPANTVKIIAPHEGPLASLAEARELPLGEIGEIIVTGPTVTEAYDDLPEATAAAKIPASASTPLGFDNLGSRISAPPGAVWHRMGDLGRLDAQGRLWFAGRKAETVHTPQGTLYPACVEPLFDIHNAVRRTALIAIGKNGSTHAALVVEPIDPAMVKNSADCRRLARELRAIAQRHPHTALLKTFYFHPSLPVDVRHNAKIHRLTLARWAATEGVGFESDPKR
jgi:acyl-CoA synthetase (AMP-forming)/AMP-acid ligase II